jgi:hypothetical protein
VAPPSPAPASEEKPAPEEKPAEVSRLLTLSPEDLAEVLDTSKPAIPAPPPGALEPPRPPDADSGPLPKVKTISEVPTNPALAQAMEKLEPLKATAQQLSEQATQPALRRMPITDMATQARLDVLPINELATQAKLDVRSAEVQDLEPIPTAPGAAAPVAPAAAAPPAQDAQPASPPPASAAPTAPASAANSGGASSAPEKRRPPRVSQLIAALQAQQGPPRPQPEPAASPAPSPMGRVSPGLVAPAPDLLQAVSPYASSAQDVVTPSQIDKAPEVSWVLRHQEAVAAMAGAALVLVIALIYLLVKS